MLAASPIDYDRRREIDYSDLVPDPQWHDICQDTATPIGRAVKARLHRCWLYERLTGSPARTCPHAINNPRFFAALADLPRTLSPEVVAMLHEAGRDFLDGHGLADEPLLWVPGLEDCAGLGHTLSAWTDQHVEEVHRLVVEEQLSLSAIAERTGSTIEVVRETLNRHPASRELSEASLRAVGGPTAYARRALSRAQFCDLYVGQRLSLAVIAAQIGVSRQTLTRLAHHYGIDLRSPTVRSRTVDAP